MVDKIYAMSSFLQFRMVYDPKIMFSEKLGVPLRSGEPSTNSHIPINTAEELNIFLKKYIERETADKKVALALSGGVDSAIIATFMPKGSVAYTTKSVVPGKKVFDEVDIAQRYCDINDLQHRVVDIFWEDYEKFSPILMKYKKAPIHSIEVQIYKMALQAKQDGFERLIFGAGADLVFGGFNKLLSKDYTIGEFIDRYSFVLPYKALKEYKLITDPFVKWTDNGMVDVYGFINDVFACDSENSFTHPCEAADVISVAGYYRLAHDIDIPRIRRGDSKYILRDLFRQFYPNLEIPEKTPFPRAVTEWLTDWQGPKRAEFWENCHINMTGDQKYYVWILEKFLEEMNI